MEIKNKKTLCLLEIKYSGGGGIEAASINNFNIINITALL